MSESSDQYLKARQTWERYGVSDTTILRWLEDDRMGFPKPIYFGRFRYWKIADLEAWELSLAKRREAADARAS